MDEIESAFEIMQEVGKLKSKVESLENENEYLRSLVERLAGASDPTPDIKSRVDAAIERIENMSIDEFEEKLIKAGYTPTRLASK